MRVLAVPGRHPYVTHLSAPGGDGVVRVDGDRDHAPGAGPMAWPDLSAVDLAGVDLVHVHAGLTTGPETGYRSLVQAAKELGLPLVVTVHDLPHPHHPDPEPLAAQLEVLVPAADELVTVTVTAARRVLAQWGRLAHVLPHPHVLDAAELGQTHRTVGPPVVGVPNATAGHALGALVDGALEVVEQVPGARLRVDLVDGSRGAPDLAERLAPLALRGVLDLRLHEPTVATDPAVYLRQVDVCLLHRQDASSATWLEACFDAGVPAVAPEHSLYADRSCALGYLADRPATVADALRAALAGHPVRQADREERLAERELVALAHAELYGAVLDARV